MTEKEIVQEIRKRQSWMEEGRSEWEKNWERIAQLVNPRREFMRNAQYVKGQKIGKQIYDGTPVSALMIFMSGLLGYTASPSMAWFSLKMQDPRLKNLPEVPEWLEECTEIFYYQFAISNFYNGLAQYIMDAGSVGTSTMHIEENLNLGKLNFPIWHPKEVYVQENAYGDVDTLHRKFKQTAKKAYELYGEKLSHSIKQSVKKNPYQEFEFINAIYPNTDRVFGKMDNQNMPFRSIHIQGDGNDRILKSGGYRTFPDAVWRWWKNEGEVYGRSPAWFALVDIEKLQVESKTNTQARQLAVTPAYQAPAGQKGKLKLSPGAVNYYTRNLEEERIMPVHTGVDLSSGYQEVQETREIVKKHFFVDFFLMISQADVEMTATEILERQSEKAVMLGPFISIMNNEAYNSMFDRVWDILWEGGKLPPPPPALANFPGAKIDIEYLGPLAQAQKVLFKSPRRALNSMLPYTEILPQMLDWFNEDELVKLLADAHGYPASALKSEEQVKALREQREKMIQQQQAVETNKGVAEAAKDAAKAESKSGRSLLDKMLNARMPARRE